MNCPPEGFCTEASLVRVIDGDTIEVEIKRTLKVRLKDIRVAEKNTEDGQAALACVKDILGPPNSTMKLFIPANHPLPFSDIQTFDRVLGKIFVGKGESWTDLGELLKEKGLARDGKKEGF